MSEVISTPRYLSPLLLAQEFVRHSPWQLLATCILLNRTNGMKQVKPVLADFFSCWSGPRMFLSAREDEVKAFLKPLGFQNIRYDRLRGMSEDWLAGKRPPKEKLRGVGTYGRESFEIFVLGYLIMEPHDKELKRYVRWAQEERSSGGHGLHHDGPGRVQRSVQAPQSDALLKSGEGVAEEVEEAIQQSD